jgi:hypothetical protein
MKCGAHNLVIHDGSLWNIVYDAHGDTVSGTSGAQQSLLNAVGPLVHLVHHAANLGLGFTV